MPDPPDSRPNRGPGPLAVFVLFDRLHCCFADKTAIHEHGLHGPCHRGDTVQRRPELFLIVGGLPDALADDQPAVHLDRGLRIVTLLEMSGPAGGHDTAVRIGEVVLVFRFRRRRWWWTGAIGVFFDPLALCLGEGAGFQLRAGLPQSAFAHVPPRRLVLDGQPVLQRLGVCRVGLGEQLFDFQFDLLQLLAGALVTHRGMFAGVGEHLGAVDGDRDLAHLQHLTSRSQFEHLRKATGEQLPIAAPERILLASRMSWSGWVSAQSSRTATLSSGDCSMRRLLNTPVE